MAAIFAIAFHESRPPVGRFPRVSTVLFQHLSYASFLLCIPPSATRQTSPLFAYQSKDRARGKASLNVAFLQDKSC